MFAHPPAVKKLTLMYQSSINLPRINLLQMGLSLFHGLANTFNVQSKMIVKCDGSFTICSM
ncbi:hypothetical protein SAMN03080602_04408 [Arenibacter troitsensis]|uniref:Uncharacterized protein n=1 Tax=Arenibacter troitsensis TaxID=188872 RepID=A0A1X7LKS6_9FLAO|nr:hypothetical protein SAMN03080602_04408 [Arenibacter troitsensis]